MNKNLYKILFWGSFVFLVIAGAWGIKRTRAFFSDIEVSKENKYEAGVLDLSTSPDINITLENASSVTEEIRLENVGTLPFQYKSELEGNGCGFLEITTGGPGELEAGFSLKDIILINPKTLPVSGACQYKLKYTAWQKNITDSLIGLRDEEEVNLNITILNTSTSNANNSSSPAPSSKLNSLPGLDTLNQDITIANASNTD